MYLYEVKFLGLLSNQPETIRIKAKDLEQAHKKVKLLNPREINLICPIRRGINNG
jgi:hypothetical protein